MKIKYVELICPLNQVIYMHHQDGSETLQKVAKIASAILCCNYIILGHISETLLVI